MISKLLLVIAFLFNSGLAEKPEVSEWWQTVQKALPKVKPVDDDEKKLLQYTEIVAEVDNLRFYKKVSFKLTKSQKPVPFHKMSKMDQDVFILMKMEGVSEDLDALNEKWTEKFKESDKDDLLGRLKNIRSELAKKHEKHAEKVFGTYDDFTKEEAELYLRVLRSHHDEDHLIEREKP